MFMLCPSLRTPRPSLGSQHAVTGLRVPISQVAFAEIVIFGISSEGCSEQDLPAIQKLSIISRLSSHLSILSRAS